MTLLLKAIYVGATIPIRREYAHVRFVPERCLLE